MSTHQRPPRSLSHTGPSPVSARAANNTSGSTMRHGLARVSPCVSRLISEHPPGLLDRVSRCATWDRLPDFHQRCELSQQFLRRDAAERVGSCDVEYLERQPIDLDGPACG